MAYTLQYLHYSLTRYTSAVSLSVIGSLKTIFIVLLGVQTFGNSLSGLNIFGLFLTTTCAALYGYYRMSDRINFGDIGYPSTSR